MLISRNLVGSSQGAEFRYHRNQQSASPISRQDMARACHRLIVRVKTQVARLPRIWSWSFVFICPTNNKLRKLCEEIPRVRSPFVPLAAAIRDLLSKSCETAGQACARL